MNKRWNIKPRWRGRGGSLFSLVELGWYGPHLGLSKLCSCEFGSLGHSSGSHGICALGASESSVKHFEAPAILHLSSCMG